MFNPTEVVIEAFIEVLVTKYINMYGASDDDIQIIVSNSRVALEVIANSNAPYHDITHTMMVTLVGTEILAGKTVAQGNVSTSDWIHFVVSLLNHDIGYVRGICKADRNGRYAINSDGDTIAPPAGSTDAFLTPYHVDRGKLYLMERFAHELNLDIQIICANIERTRFPVPDDSDKQVNDDFPGLLRAADLIGQLADPHYFRKISCLFAEFSETGQAQSIGYETAADLQRGYPGFFWQVVSPYIAEGLRFLRRTQEGQSWVANLHANIFSEEHEEPTYGPERRASPERRDSIESPFDSHELTENDNRGIKRRSSDALTDEVADKTH